MSPDIEWDEDSLMTMSPKERRDRELAMRMGYPSMPHGWGFCSVCKLPSEYAKKVPAVGDLYECVNCKTVILVRAVEENERMYQITTTKFRSRYDVEVFRRTKTREEFRNRFERGAMGIFHVRSGSESGDGRA